MSIKKQYGHYLAFSLGNILVSYLLLLFLANSLSKSEYAQYGVLTSVMSLLLILVNFGHKEALFKLSSQNRIQDVARYFGTLQLWLCGCVFFSLLALFFNLETGLAALAFLALYLMTLVSNIHRGLGFYLRDAVSLPLYRGIWLLGCLGVYCLAGDLDIVGVFAVAALASLMALTIVKGVSTLCSYVQPISRLTLPFGNPLLRNFFLLEVATIAYMKLDVLLLSAYGVKEVQVAEYFFAIQVFEACVLLTSPLSYLFFNRYNRRTNDKDSLWRHLWPFVGLLLLVVIFILVGWQLLGPWLLAWMFPAYEQSHTLISLLLLALLPMGLSMLLSHWLFARDKEWSYVKICAAGLLLCSIGNILLIPHFAGIGAAITRLATECVIALLLICVCYWLLERDKKTTA
ncbi:hypothetical protein GCM10009092_17460 [Bowmanella denitrificans]|uniref:Polysaccharide biosynthesis protein C-terminal domain-containing protein n=1 Tax=Bowmanella denitrificans TaxID=366582 RepID=A0ABP3GWD7_9ALTE